MLAIFVLAPPPPFAHHVPNEFAVVAFTDEVADHKLWVALSFDVGEIVVSTILTDDVAEIVQMIEKFFMKLGEEGHFAVTAGQITKNVAVTVFPVLFSDNKFVTGAVGSGVGVFLYLILAVAVLFAVFGGMDGVVH